MKARLIDLGGTAFPGAPSEFGAFVAAETAKWGDLVKKADIKSRGFSKISPMPPGLVNMLSREEILDLLAYLEAGGHKDGAPFKK